MRYIGASWDGHEQIEVPDVTLFDAMIAYEEEHWRWSINARNLEDKEYMIDVPQRAATASSAPPAPSRRA